MLYMIDGILFLLGLVMVWVEVDFLFFSLILAYACCCYCYFPYLYLLYLFLFYHFYYYFYHRHLLLSLIDNKLGYSDDYRYDIVVCIVATVAVKYIKKTDMNNDVELNNED